MYMVRRLSLSARPPRAGLKMLTAARPPAEDGTRARVSTFKAQTNMMAARINISRRSFLSRRFGPRLKLFLSYRRRFDTASARLLKGELTDAFGEGAVFLDIDDIAPGDVWTESIREAVESCDVFLTLISPGWVELSGKLQEPGDFIREEIAAALARRVPLIPVLIGGAQMPKPESLPFSLRELTSRQAQELSDRHWGHDIEYLVEAIREVVAQRPPATFAERAVAAFRFLFWTRLGKLISAAVLLAAAALTYAAVRNGLIFPSYEKCVGQSSPVRLADAAEVQVGARDTPVVSGDEYGRVTAAGPEGFPLLLRLRDSERELGSVILRYFKGSEVFKVEKVVEPRCADVGRYLNDDRQAGDKRVLQNWDRLRVSLGGRDYLLRLGDKGDRVLATLTPAAEPAPAAGQ